MFPDCSMCPEMWNNSLGIKFNFEVIRWFGRKKISKFGQFTSHENRTNGLWLIKESQAFAKFSGNALHQLKTILWSLLILRESTKTPSLTPQKSGTGNNYLRMQ